MRKIIFIGRSEAGKTTLTQAMKGEKITYHKTQYVNHFAVDKFLWSGIALSLSSAEGESPPQLCAVLC